MGGLVGYGAYIPYYRLERTRIAGVLGQGGGSGTRSVAAFDEDTTSMAVAAGRAALAGMTPWGGPGGPPGRGWVRQLFFATTAPAYADKTYATAVHAALRLPAGEPGRRAEGVRPPDRRVRAPDDVRGLAAAAR
jgi:hydroxymethylglutaryl-CoA synthase